MAFFCWTSTTTFTARVIEGSGEISETALFTFWFMRLTYSYSNSLGIYGRTTLLHALHLPTDRTSLHSTSLRSTPLRSTSVVIRPSLLQVFGGVVAPRLTRGFTNRYFARMATMAQTAVQGNGEVAGTMHNTGDGMAQENGSSNGAAQSNGKRRKLHGRAFYESIGSPKLILAPMVEQSEFVCLFTSIRHRRKTMANIIFYRHGDYYRARSSPNLSRKTS